MPIAEAESSVALCVERARYRPASVKLATPFRIKPNNPMSKSQFRWLVALSVILALLAGTLDLMIPSLLPEAVSTAQEQYWAQLSTFELLTFACLFLGAVVLIVATYGLFFFKKWGPSLSVTATVLSVLATAVGPFGLFSGPAFALLDLASYAWGAAIIVCYLEPYRGWFKGGST